MSQTSILPRFNAVRLHSFHSTTFLSFVPLSFSDYNTYYTFHDLFSTRTLQFLSVSEQEDQNKTKLLRTTCESGWSLVGTGRMTQLPLLSMANGHILSIEICLFCQGKKNSAERKAFLQLLFIQPQRRGLAKVEHMAMMWNTVKMSLYSTS